MKYKAWDRLLQREKDWIINAGFNENDVNELPDDTVTFLKYEYAARGFQLNDMLEMTKRILNKE